MKKILLILSLITVLTSCSEWGGSVEHNTITILKKSQGTETDEYNTPYYYIYIFNGDNSKWYSTNQNTYNMYNVGDTINTLVFTDE